MVSELFCFSSGIATQTVLVLRWMLLFSLIVSLIRSFRQLRRDEQSANRAQQRREWAWFIGFKAMPPVGDAP